MNTLAAFAMGEMARARGAKMRVFDWDQAARIIRERGITDCEAGLSGDLEYTCGAILRDGKPVLGDDSYTYLASLWAAPVLVLSSGEEIRCETTDASGWDAKTKWPESALAILSGATP